jgi:hypothetical protein
LANKSAGDSQDGMNGEKMDLGGGKLHNSLAKTGLELVR